MTSFIKISLRSSRFQLAGILTLAWIAYLAQYHDSARFVIVPLVTIAVGFVVDRLLRRLVRSQHTQFSSLITTLLVALIVSPEAPFYVGSVAVTLALLSKYIIRTRRHWFNPAAIGIFAASIVFGVFPGWWMTAGSRAATVIVAGGMIYVLYKLKRLWSPVTFLIIYYARAFFLPRGLDLNIILDGTVLLFAFIMLTEPITSPALGKWKYGFGALVAIFIIALNALALPFSFDTLLASLLLGNGAAIFFSWLSRKWVRSKQTTEAPTASTA